MSHPFHPSSVTSTTNNASSLSAYLTFTSPPSTSYDFVQQIVATAAVSTLNTLVTQSFDSTHNSTFISSSSTVPDEQLMFTNSTQPPSSYSGGNATTADPNNFVPISNYSLFETVVIAVVAGLFSLLTVAGNVLVLVSFKLDKQLQTVSNYFLLSLAIADLFIGAVSMPLYTIYLLLDRWPLGPFICDLWLAFDYLNSNASVLNLLLISFDRYFSVTRPLTYRVRRTTKRACLMIASTWIMSLLLWPPWIFAWPYIEGKRTVPYNQCYIQFLETNSYITFGTALAAFYVPVSVMCFLYWRIWRETEKRYKDLTTLFLVSARVPAVTSKMATGGQTDGSSQEGGGGFWKSLLLLSRRSNNDDDDDEDDEDEDDNEEHDEDNEDDNDGGDEEDEVNGKGDEESSHRRTSDRMTAQIKSRKSINQRSMNDDDNEESLTDCKDREDSSSACSATASIYTILITLSSPGDHLQGMTTTSEETSTASTPHSQWPIPSIKQFSESMPAIVTHSTHTNACGQLIGSRSNTLEKKRISSGNEVKGGQKRRTNSSASSATVTDITGKKATAKSKAKKGKRGGQTAKSTGNSKAGSGTGSHISQPKSEKKAAKTLSAILLAFVITWTPYNVLVLIKTLSGKHFISIITHDHLYTLSVILKE